MKKVKERYIKYITCTCGYNNNPDCVMYSGVCNCCGKILDEKAYFKQQMTKKLFLWKNNIRWKG